MSEENETKNSGSEQEKNTSAQADSDKQKSAAEESVDSEAKESISSDTAPEDVKTEEEEEEEEEEGGPSMTLVEHLEELRKRIFYSLGGLFVVMFGTFFSARWWIMPLLTKPYRDAMEEIGEDPSKGLITIGPAESLFMYMKVAFIAGLIVSAPWISYHLWKFVGVGLYKRERLVIKKAVPFSAGLFIIGALFYLLVVSEPMLVFLMYFAKEWTGVSPMMTLEKYIGLVVNMMLVFGLGFQMPVVVSILGRVGIVNTKMLSNYRRYVIVCLFIFAALVTTPSPVDQILLAVPMWILYELGVLLVWLHEKKKRKQAEEEDDDDDDGPGEPAVEPEPDEPDEPEEEHQPSDPDLRDEDYEDPWPDDYYDYDYEYMRDYENERDVDEYGLWGRGDGENWEQKDGGIWGSEDDQWVDPLSAEENTDKNKKDDEKEIKGGE